MEGDCSCFADIYAELFDIEEDQMILGFAKETYPGEKRAALVPSVLPGLKKAGFDFVMETGAGLASGFNDAAYQERGARIVPDRQEVIRASDIILYVRGLGADRETSGRDMSLYLGGQIIVGMLDPSNSQAELKQLAEIGVTAFALELMPRITRAQSMDVLSSMATVAGYKAVLLAASALPKMFPLLMTAAGTITAAHVLVIGAGVAGLQAIATAKRLGALVQAYDIRPAVKEQVESLGAKFVELPLETGQSEAVGGYAKAMDEEFYRRQRELMKRVVVESEVVICTAAVPGKRAPVLITQDMLQAMKPGSIIVDLAAEQGGNCELTRPGETILHGNITIMGPVNLASSVPYDSSQMYARNITNFLLHLVDKDGKIRLDDDDEIIQAARATVRPAISEAAASGS
ncbi:MAG: NAD(P) transhydrogenase subunit alpha [candidate division Zixibacteria bacterium RBG_16_53_22]|nr:MAG: NAD(P) transhydrogenase subunit alpha [candidate division Zixibacteria bacterium RBG_16_53_22]